MVKATKQTKTKAYNLERKWSVSQKKVKKLGRM